MTPTYKSIDDLPVTLNANNIREYMGISKSMAHALLNSEGFPTLRINTRKIVPRDAFLRWLDTHTGKQVNV